MKKINKVIFISLPVIAVTTFFMQFEYVWNFIKEYSYDGEIKDTTKIFYQDLFNKGRFAILIISLMPLIYFYFFNNLSKLIDNVVRSILEKLKSFVKYFSIDTIFVTSFVFSIIFIVAAVFLFDIGQDPSYYLNDLQNIEKYGFITRDYDTGGTNIYLIPNMPFNILSYAYVKIFGFSVIGIRFIIVLFTILFIYSLYLYLEKEIFKYSYVLIFSIPGIYSLTSEIFLEIAALSFIFLSLHFLNKFETQRTKRFQYFSILFMVIAFTTKFQLFVYLFLIFTAMILLERDIERKRFLLHYLIKSYILIFLIVIVTILPFGINEVLIYLNWYFISNTAEGRGFLTTSDLKLFMVNEILFVPLFILAIYLYYKYSGNSIKFYSFHFISLFSIINVVYWLIFFSSVTWRNIIYAGIFLCIMLAVILIHHKNLAKVVLVSFFLFGLFANFIFLHHGVIDDIQFLKERFKPIVFTRDISQKNFFEKAKKIIEPESNVYVPALPYLSRVYLDNRRIILLDDFKANFENRSYLIFDKNAFNEDRYVSVKEKTFKGDYKEIIRVGNYYLFEILNK